MALNGKELKLFRFYESCIQKGYTDMSDENQSLKAKVIAVDLGIKYKDIAKIFEEAADVYEKECAQRSVDEQLRKESEAHKAIDGVELLTLDSCDKKNETALTLFRRPDGSIYCVPAGKTSRIEGAPTINVHKGGSLAYSYHPSKTVFTGASSGGIMMGGFHETKAYYTESVNSSVKGYITITIVGYNFTVERVAFSESVQEAFKREDLFKKYARYGVISLVDHSHDEINNMLIRSELSKGRGNYYNSMATLSRAADDRRLPMNQVQDIARIINAIIEGKYPESDDMLYARAQGMESAETSKELSECIALYKKISDYLDSEDRIKVVQERYEEILQKEKELAVIAREEKAVATRKKLFVIVPMLIVLIAAIVVVSMYVSKQKELAELKAQYVAAVELLENGNYSEAKTMFAQLGDFNDASATMIPECIYREALANKEAGAYSAAITGFESIPTYKDAEAQRILVRAAVAEEYKSEAESYFSKNLFSDAEEAMEKAIKYLDDADAKAKCNDRLSYYKDMETYEDACRLLEEGYIHHGYAQLQKLDTSFAKTAQLMEICETYMPYLGRWTADDYCYWNVGEQPKPRKMTIAISMYINTDTLEYTFDAFGMYNAVADGVILRDDDYSEKYEAHMIFDLSTGEYNSHFWNYNNATLESWTKANFMWIQNDEADLGVSLSSVEDANFRMSQYDLRGYAGKWMYSSASTADKKFFGESNPTNSTSFIFTYNAGKIEVAPADDTDSVMMILSVNPFNGEVDTELKTSDSIYYSSYYTFQEKHSSYISNGYDNAYQYPDKLIFSDGDVQYLMIRK